jgi:3-phosphoshikimate 1-carboxyvinyltransferase
MNLKLNYNNQHATSTSQLAITGSKSETNRLLLLQALYPNLGLENISKSDDSDAMNKALTQNGNLVDIHHAGTAMRFLTAYFSTQERQVTTITGSARMQERPIGVLVEALKQLGAQIEYVNNDGFPPLKITGKKLTENKVTIAANVSSQYISALLLIAPKLENGIELTLEGEITSVPYIKMTLALLNDLGIETSFEENIIKVNSKFKIQNSTFTIESDWSSASYWFSIIALSEIGTNITLSSYKENSLQADAELVDIYKSFGVSTTFENNQITISKVSNKYPEIFDKNLKNCPDIAQTIAVTCFGLGICCELKGLHTLKIKETDRLEALKTELTKLGASISVTENALLLLSRSLPLEGLGEAIDTYQDHRMAMAFAPLAIKLPIIINEAEVVSKSYPTFWDDLTAFGFLCEEIS